MYGEPKNRPINDPPSKNILRRIGYGSVNGFQDSSYMPAPDLKIAEKIQNLAMFGIGSCLCD